MTAHPSQSTPSLSSLSANASLPAALRDEERQPCEVWTRVMGYHRPVASFNAGKQGEHRERRFFAQPDATAA
ncbi:MULTISPECIES: anaerobic ribonucleoside-triphosphate reductase [Cupriavidus]